MHFPEIVNVDVLPAVVDQAAFDHRIGRSLDFLRRDGAGKTVPTIPAQSRGQCDLRAADDLELALARAKGVARAQGHEVSAFFLDTTGDASTIRIQLQSLGQPFGAETHGSVAGGCDGIEKWRAGAHAEDLRAVDGRSWG